MENSERRLVDLYISCKCSTTNCLTTAKNHGSIQLEISDIDVESRALNTLSTYALCLNHLATQGGKNVWSYQQ
ncbi:40S ribosomal protein S21, partial [Hesseltinella vesiculosa]